MKTLLSTALSILALQSIAPAHALTPQQRARIEELTGWKGKQDDAEGVFKISKPRTEPAVRVGGRAMAPFLGLTSWVSFLDGKKNQAMIMGDLVLLEGEVTPVMDALFAGGIDVTALHNHFFFEEPRVFFLHVSGEGEPEKLASALRKAFDLQGAKGKHDDFELPAQSSLAADKLDAVLKAKGEAKDGMYKAVFGRSVKMPCDCEAGKQMGVNTWAAFAGKEDAATVDGDFAVLEDELQPVLRSLRKGGIHIVAIHSHMTHERPRMLFLHYWGQGAASALAKTVRSALDLQK